MKSNNSEEGNAIGERSSKIMTLKNQTDSEQSQSKISKYLQYNGCH